MKSSELATMIKLQRARKGISQEQLAKTTGLAIATISFIECGVITKPRASTLVKIADALGADANEWLKKYDTMKDEK